jgi:CRISPR type IV-associated protein Csf1
MDTTSSTVIAKAMGVTPSGVPAKNEGICALCGKTINLGDPCSHKLDLGSSFMDDLDMACRGSQMLCGYCLELKTAQNLRATGFGVFSSKDGVLPFRKWPDVGRALVNPPEPPFCMTYALNNNQHMAWRAPVNLSKDLFYVRVGLRDLKIRRKKLLEAVEHCRVLAEAVNDLQGKKENPKAKTKPNPFSTLAPDFKDPNHGRLKTIVFQKNLAHLRPHVDALLDLTQGETWALRFVLSVEVDV